MGGFAIRCAAFFAPLAALLVLAVGSLYHAGELMSPANVVRAQEQSPALYYPMAHPRSVYPQYKLLAVQARHPDILVLGSSVMNSLRGEFLRDHRERFYNASLWGAANIGFARQFLELLPPDCLPRRVLISADPWWFFRDIPAQPPADFFRSSTRLEIIDFSWRTGLWWLTRPRSRLASAAIGILAKDKDSGFRPDGSFLAGEALYANRWSTQKADLAAFAQGQDLWFHKGAPGISSAALDEMRRFLQYCAERKIDVIGFTSPVNPAVYNLIRKDPRSNFIMEIPSAVGAVFRQQGFKFFDLLDPAVSGCSAGEYTDLVHYSEVCELRSLLAMIRQDTGLKSLFDPQMLEKFLANRKSDIDLGF